MRSQLTFPLSLLPTRSQVLACNVMWACAVLLLVLETSLTPNVQAQDPTVPMLRFESVSIAAGLPSMRVWDVLQDREGFLWFATENGLARYDGHAVDVFRHGGPGTLSHDQVWSLFEDHAGTLWAGTYRGGLNRFDPATETFTQYHHDPDDPTSLGDDRVRAIYESSREPGVLWIGTMSGLNRFDTRTGTFTRYLPGEFVFAIHEDAAGTLWVGSLRGLWRKRPAPEAEWSETGSASGAAFTVHQPPSISGWQEPVSVTAIVEDETGMLWVSTRGGGVQRFDPSAETFAPVNASASGPLGRAETTSLLRDQGGVLWAGTYGDGLLRIDPETGTATRYRHDPETSSSLASDIVRALYEDRTGLLWAATWGGGVSRIRRERFGVMHPKQGLPGGVPSGDINAIAEDANRDLWVGYARGGVIHVSQDDEAGVAYEHYGDAPEALSSLMITSLLASDTDPEVVWVGTADGGLNRLNRRTGAAMSFRPAYADASVPEVHRVLALASVPCAPGWLWVGTNDGVWLFDTAADTFTPIDLGVPRGQQVWVEHIVEPAEDPCTLWFSGRHHGVFRVAVAGASSPGVPPTYTVSRHMPTDSMGVPLPLEEKVLFARTPDERLWFGGGGASPGLVAYDPASRTTTIYDESDGLPSNYVTSAQLDDRGHLWIATSHGLSRLDPFTNTFQPYDLVDDLRGNVPTWRTVHKGTSGTIYFGGVKGVIVVRPDEVRHNEHVPPVVLTGLRIGDRPVPVRAISVQTNSTEAEPFALRRALSHTDALTLRHDADVITLSFAALEFTAPEKNRYRYQLKGFDPAWREAGTENTATYTNLDPGRYVFHVQGSNNDGVWNEAGARLAIRILPPWYQTPLAYAFYIVLAISGIMAFVYGRERRLRQRATELEMTVAERTEELRQQQVQLEAQTEALQEANAFQSRFLANISHEFRTPLTLTFGPINDLLEGRYQVEETALPHFERARRNGHRLLRLINQLLELSRLDAGALRLSAHRYDLAQHLREIAALFQDIARHRHLAFATHLPDDPVWHVFDADKIEKVVTNLLSNAVKFTPPGSAVSLSLMKEADGAIRIVVEDTGPGISAEHLPHLFDRFYQVENTETRAYEGSGIGLALVQELVALHQGRITVESTPGEGATFTVYLPVLEETGEEEMPPQHQGDSSAAMVPLSSSEHLALVEETLETTTETEDETDAPEKDATVVLVVEDNADMRAYIRSHLEADYTIIEAANGHAGLNQAQEWVPNLVLSDVMMPEMDGLALTKALKQDIRTSHIPVVLLTAKEEVKHRIAGFESGADAYLPKPFDAEELRVRVRGLIDERQRLRVLFAGGDAEQQETLASALPAIEQAFLAKVHEHIGEHLSEASFGVDDLAEELHLSRRQLLRKLQALTDESPGVLLRRMRLEQAIVLLREGASAKEVAHAVGFRDYSAFWRAFNKVYDTSPTAYLENC